MALDAQERMYVEQRVTNEGPSALLAYLLWFVLGIFSAHRFYFGKIGTAILQILSYFIVIGVIWWIIDAFLIPGWVKARQEELRLKYTGEVEAGRGLSS